MRIRGAKILCAALTLVLCQGDAPGESPGRSRPLTAEHVQVLATAYAHRFICVCAVADRPIWHGDYWEIPIDTADISRSTASIRIDRRTGEISYPGQPSVGVGEVEQWLKQRKAGSKR